MNSFVRRGYEWVARLGMSGLMLLGLWWLFITFGTMMVVLITAIVGFATYVDIIQTMEDYGHLFEDEDDWDDR